MAIVRTTTRDSDTTKVTPTQTKTAPPRSAAGVQRAPASQRPVSAGTFIQETRTELAKVKWPTRDEVQNGTIVTIGLLIFFALFIFAADSVVAWLFHALGLYTGQTPIK